jgi:hypothetical protein
LRIVGVDEHGQPFGFLVCLQSRILSTVYSPASQYHLQPKKVPDSTGKRCQVYFHQSEN